MDIRLDGPQIAVFIDFENVATSAEATLGDFDTGAVMDLLRARGRLLIKRAYGDWGRFQRYRRPMLENGIDLFQLYSMGMQHKNRADIRLAIDALETVFTRPHIDVYAIVSGDSDFTELIHKLRDYGKYTIGIGLHAATSDLLRRACDEFIFYETLVSDELVDIAEELQLPDPRDLLRRALTLAEQKGEMPVFAGRLKQVMLGLDSSFNEANHGFQQFRAFLEAHRDILTIQEEGLQLYVGLRQDGGEAALSALAAVPPQPIKPVADLAQRYRSFLREAGMRIVDPATRRQVLDDFLEVLRTPGEPATLTDAADLLKDRYDGLNSLTQKIAVSDVCRLILMSGALEYAGGRPGSDAAVCNAHAISPDDFALAADAVYAWRLVEGAVPVFPDQLGPVLYGGDGGTEQAAALCARLEALDYVARAGESLAVSPGEIARLVDRAELGLPMRDLARVALPAGEPITTMTAERLFKEGSDLRQKDFAGSALRYLQAARVQLDALRAGLPRAGFDDLRWYLASYCSVKAGHAFVSGNFGEAVPYYLAFFSLAQEADSVWPRIQRLVNPMSSYFFAIAGRQMGETVPPNLGRTPAAQIAVRIHNHISQDVSRTWEELLQRLAQVNLGIVRQTLRELRALEGPHPVTGDESAPLIARTVAFLQDLIEGMERVAEPEPALAQEG